MSFSGTPPAGFWPPGGMPPPTPPDDADTTSPNLADYLVFIRTYAGIPAGVLADDSPWIASTYELAVTLVNDTLKTMVPLIYTLAVYNLGTDRLINFALDIPGGDYFQKLRAQLGIMSFAAGLVASSSDQGSSQSLEVIEAAKRMTIGNVQLMKTPFGRQYLDFTQSYGPTVWGLS